MNAQSISLCLSSTLQTSHRLLTALLCHCPALFPDVCLDPYIPPLTSSGQLPDEPELMEQELLKQESLLAQIHAEMNIGFISKPREELLWEVQRIITQLKRKLKIANKDKEAVVEKVCDEKPMEDAAESLPSASVGIPLDSETQRSLEEADEIDNLEIVEPVEVNANEANVSDTSSVTSFDKNLPKDNEKCEESEPVAITPVIQENSMMDKTLTLLQFKNTLLNDLKRSLIVQIETEKAEIAALRDQLPATYCNSIVTYTDANCASLDEIMYLLCKENQILQIKKINLVRQIMEQQEACIDLQTNLDTLP